MVLDVQASDLRGASAPSTTADMLLEVIRNTSRNLKITGRGCREATGRLQGEKAWKELHALH